MLKGERRPKKSFCTCWRLLGSCAHIFFFLFLTCLLGKEQRWGGGNNARELQQGRCKQITTNTQKQLTWVWHERKIDMHGKNLGKQTRNCHRFLKGRLCVTLSTREKGEDWRNLARLGRT